MRAVAHNRRVLTFVVEHLGGARQMGGVTTKVKVAHMRLYHSRMPFVRAYPREAQEMVFDAHDRAFAFFGGA